MSTVTAGNKEHEFEEYCRMMVRLTVTPNLIPQTYRWWRQQGGLRQRVGGWHTRSNIFC